MRAALICMAGQDSSEKKMIGGHGGHSGRDENLEMEHALAIAREMRDGGRIAPLLICAKDSQLEVEASKKGIPFLALARSLNPINLFGLWRWQRKQPWLQILAIGKDSLPLGKRLFSMRKPARGQFNAAFFLRPPQKNCLKELCLASHCLCGSWFVREKLAEMLENQANSEKEATALLDCQPGMNLENYGIARKEYVEDKNGISKRHFVFGMAESLLPRSGALLVARAMAAIWQREDLPSWEVRMFGSGPRYMEILEEARALGVNSRLCILSDQPLAEVSGHCDAWLAPGASPEELPQTLWAGFAARLPLICVQSRLHRERLQLAPPNSALRVEENNPQEMARAMMAVMRDPRLRQRMIQVGNSVLENISLDAMASRVCSFLESWLPPKHEESKRKISKN